MLPARSRDHAHRIPREEVGDVERGLAFEEMTRFYQGRIPGPRVLLDVHVTEDPFCDEGKLVVPSDVFPGTESEGGYDGFLVIRRLEPGD